MENYLDEEHSWLQKAAAMQTGGPAQGPGCGQGWGPAALAPQGALDPSPLTDCLFVHLNNGSGEHSAFRRKASV